MAGQTFTISVEIEGLDKLQSKLKSKTAAAPARRFLTRTGNEIVKQAKPLVPVNTGTLKRTVTKVVGNETPVPTTVVVGTNITYAPFVEFGRKPGRMPPVAPIDFWVRRKNKIGPDVDISRQVYIVRRTIGRRGVKERPFLRDGTTAAVPMIQRFVQVFADELEEAYKRGGS